MLYRVNEKNGDRLSALGFGCMRLPRKGGAIDQEKAGALIRAAVAAGVNYFDTAYIYPGSEAALGEALQQAELREQVFLATKLPLQLIRTREDMDRCLDKQLQRLRTGYVDYYLLHMLGSVDLWERLRTLGVEEWIARKKADGVLRNIGFSFHGGRYAFERLIDAYPWDFCMIQYNYLDEHNQAGRTGLAYARNRGVPVFVMEPLRGGMLVNGLPAAARDVFSAAAPGRSLAEWGLRWVLDQAEVGMLLSGMGDQEQLAQNVLVAGEAGPGCVTDAERVAYSRAVQATKTAVRVSCTACGYCMPCPHGVDIPTCFSCYNESFSGAPSAARRRYLMATGAVSIKPTGAARCTQCRACEQRCPQGIAVSGEMQAVARRMEPPLMRAALSLARRVMRARR